ncbi:hypothetical protein SH139x_003495 [Planctomycetaceae bacterium SH139]
MAPEAMPLLMLNLRCGCNPRWRTNRLQLVACSLMLMLIVGCSDSAGWIDMANQQMDAQPISIAPPLDIIDANPQTNSEFKPENPDRVNPFVYTGSHASSDGSTYTGPLSSVLVQGFASSAGDEKAVILQIAGETHTMRETETIAGIKVIQITPPVVKLSSGTSEWTASLFDRSKVPARD